MSEERVARRPVNRMVSWYWQHRFGLIFCLLLVAIAVHPLLAKLAELSGIAVFRWAMFLEKWLLALALIACVAGLVRERARTALLVVGTACLAGRGVGEFLGDMTLRTVGEGAWVAVCVLGIVASVRRTLRPGTVDSERIFAALAAYLLAGIAFGAAFWSLEMTWTDSFGSPDTGDLTQFKALYFSFVTLATLGYGDIVPASDVTRGIAVLEAVLGQTYLAVLVARLVSLYGSSDEQAPREQE